ncbi:MAG: glycosyltransferase [Planctomycetota bacterium]|nr:glycosyltransferase [Planctomycetota bacterium]
MPNPISSEPEPPLHVAYLLKMFPRLSETFILNEVLELERQGVEVEVFSLMPPGDGRYHGSLSELKLTIRYIQREKPESFWTKLGDFEPGLVPQMDRWEPAVEFLRKYRIPRDLDMLLRALIIGAEAKLSGVQHIHAHFATISTRVAALVKILYDIPYSFTCHAKDIFRDTVDRELFRDLVERASFAITVSDFNRNFILENTPGVDAEKVIRLYNGIDLNFFETSEAPRKTDPLQIISVGRLVPKKGFDHLLNALAMLKSDNLNFRATIIGDGDEKHRLEQLCSQSGLDNEVEFTGALPIEEVRRRCADASMMVLGCVPDTDGNMDALPTVLLEALALDLPIVTTSLTGCPEIVGDDAGLLVEPANPTALADSIRTLTTSINEGKIIQGTARSRAEKLFNLSTNVSTLRGHFLKSALSGR